MRRVFNTTLDYKTDTPSRTRPDADQDSQILRADHELLWSKDLPSGDVFAPKVTTRRREYLIFTDADGERHCYGSDAITNSYTTWARPPALVRAKAGLTEEQKSLYFNTPYTIGSAMIWPVRKNDRPTMNTARGFGPEGEKIGDRMDLTLECIRRHYEDEPWSPLAKVIKAYEDFFELFGDFKGFVDFFHFQDLVKPGSDYAEVDFFLDLEDFERPGTPISTPEYVEYRDKVLEFIEKRSERMAEWVTANHPDIEVCTREQAVGA